MDISGVLIISAAHTYNVPVPVHVLWQFGNLRLIFVVRLNFEKLNVNLTNEN